MNFTLSLRMSHGCPGVQKSEDSFWASGLSFHSVGLSRTEPGIAAASIHNRAASLVATDIVPAELSYPRLLYPSPAWHCDRKYITEPGLPRIAGGIWPGPHGAADESKAGGD